MQKEELKKRVLKAIDENREEIIKVGQEIYKTPEFGFREVESTKKTSDFLKKLGLTVEENIAVTGCKAVLQGGKEGINVAVLGELDSVSCSDHCDATPNGSVHACGHNNQIAGMLGVALGLSKSGVMNELSGKVTIMATPAEEFIELEYRDSLRAKGMLKYFGGKQELIYKGHFDDVDMSMMFHSLDMNGKDVLLGPVSNGFVGKKINFKGKEAHAGSAPHEGINALNAAMLSINNIHAQRETFKESDRVRVHPIITKGGDIVNSVPADVRMESYVRARTIEGILDSNLKVDRAIKAGAMAVGANVEIITIPGYLPILKCDELDNIFKANLPYVGVTEDRIIEGGDFTGSFDMGDVSHLMPTIHPMIGGVKGNIHTRDFVTIDEEIAFIMPAKTLALSIIDLLYDDSKLGKEILKKFKPKMTKKEYLEFMEARDNVEIF